MKFAVPLLIFVVGVAIYFFRSPKVESVDEFYSANPHLPKPSKLPGPPKERDTGAFQDADYKLTPGKSWIIDFISSQDLTVRSESVFKLDGAGALELHSLGWVGQRLAVLAIISYSRLTLTPDKGANKELRKLIGPIKSEDLKLLSSRAVLLHLDPAGRVKKVFGATETSLTIASEIFLKMRSLLRSVPQLTAGQLKATEWDEADQPYSVNYVISDLGSALAFRGDVIDPGAQGPQDLSLKKELSGIVDWTWEKSRGLPGEQRFEHSEGVRFNGDRVLFSSGKNTFTWGPEVAGVFNFDSLSKLFNLEYSIRDLFKVQEASRGGDGKGPAAFLTTDQIFSRFRKVDSKDVTEAEREMVLVELSTALAKDPGLLPRLKDTAMNASVGSRELTIALGALGYAGTPAAQSVLVDAYKRNELDQDTRTKILAELAINDKPLSDGTKSFLMEVHGQGKDPTLAASAHFTVAASLWRDGDPKVSSYLQSTHQKALASDDPNQLQQSLGALGNTRSLTFLEEIQSASSDENPVIRAEAAMALRFLPGPEAEGALQTLLKDDEPDVRVSAVQAHFHRPFDGKVQDTLKGCTRDPDSGVKTECYRLLSAHASTPEIRQFLESAAGTETDSEAQRFLKNWKEGQK